MENNKEENKKGFLDSIKNVLPGTKKIKEAEKKARDAELEVLEFKAKILESEEKARLATLKALEAEEKVRVAEEKARLAEQKLKELEEQIAKERAEANKTPEEKRKERKEHALSTISERRHEIVNLEKMFLPRIGLAQEFLDDPQIVASIIKEYPESIASIPTEMFAINYELFTKNFFDGVSDICIDPKNRGYRVNHTAMEKDSELRDIPFDKNYFIQCMLSDLKRVFKEKVYSVCSKAKEIVEARESFPDNPYKNIKPKDLELEAPPQNLYEEGSPITEFSNITMHYKNKANTATKVITTEAERE